MEKWVLIRGTPSVIKAYKAQTDLHFMYSTTSMTLSRELTHAFCPGIPGRPGGPGGPWTICPDSLTRSHRRPWAACGQQTEKC